MASPEIEVGPNTSIKLDQQLESERCAASKLYFATKYFYARTERNTFEPLGKLWDAQVATIKSLDEYGWIYNLKARKLGISTIGCCIDLWTILFLPHSRVHLFSKRDEDAVDLLNRIKLAYDKIPEWMKADRIATRNNHTLELDYGDGDMRTIQAYSSDPDAGRSQSCNHAHVDEFAIVEPNDQEEMWAAIEPSIVPGGTMHMMTTGKGSQNFSADLWKRALRGESRIHPVFLPYDSRPDRKTEGWYEQKSKETPPRKMKQEYPRNWVEALIDPEKAVFPDEVRQPCYTRMEYIEEAQPGRTYIKAWDLGFQNDAAAFVVWDVTELPFWLAHVSLYQHVPYTSLQQIANSMERQFPGGFHYVESNAMGLPFIANLDFTAIPHATTVKSKPEGITRLQLIMEQKNLRYNPWMFPGNLLDDELASYTWEDYKLVQDLVISMSIAAYYAYDRIAYMIGSDTDRFDSPDKVDEDPDPFVREAMRSRNFMRNDHWSGRETWGEPW